MLINSSNPVFKIDEDKISIYDPVTLWDSINGIIEENNKIFEEQNKEYGTFRKKKLRYGQGDKFGRTAAFYFEVIFLFLHSRDH